MFKKTVSLLLSLVMLLSITANINVAAFAADEDAVESISYTCAKPYEIVENTSGRWVTKPEGGKIFSYNVPLIYKDGDILTVTYESGKTVDFVCENSDDVGVFVSKDGETISTESLTDFAYNTYWTIGGDNYINISYSNAQTQVKIYIVENPVKSVRFIQNKPVEVWENSNGYYETDSSNNEFFYYNYNLFNDATFIVDYKDGTQKTFTGLDYDGNLDVSTTDNQYSTHWTVGNTYNVTVNVSGYECNALVSVIKNPVKSVSIELATPYEILEHSKGYNDGENGWHYNSLRFREGDAISIEFNDNTSKKFFYNNESWGFYSEDNEHADAYINDFLFEGIGNTSAYVDVTYGQGSVRVSIPVSIIENPIKSFTLTSVKPYQIKERTNGYEYDGQWWYYPPNFNLGDVITVNYTNGTTEDFTYTSDDYCFVNSNDESLDVYRSEFTLDGVGETTFTVSLYGYGVETEVPVTVIENPVESITFTPVKPYEIIENSNGYEDSDGNWQYDAPYFNKGDVLTVYYKNGTTDDFVYDNNGFTNSTGETIYANRYDFEFNGVGETSFSIKIEDYDVRIDIPVTIIENPVKSFTLTSVKPYEVVKNTNGYSTEDGWKYDSLNFNDGDVITVNYTNGTKDTFTSFENRFENSKGEELSVSADRFVLNGVGKTTFTVSLDDYGKKIEVPVTVVESPVKSVSFTPVKPFEIVQGTKGYDRDGEWFYYVPEFNEGDVITLEYTNGTSEKYTYNKTDWRFCNKKGNILDVYAQAFSFNGVGKTTFNVYCTDYGKTCSVPVTIIENPVKNATLTSVKPYSIIEKTNGYYSEGVWYYRGNEFNEGDVITLEYKNGKTEKYIYAENGEDCGFFNKNGDALEFYIKNDKATLEGTGTVTFGLCLADYGNVIEYSANIVESTVASISYKSLTNFADVEGVTNSIGYDGDYWYISDGYVNSGDVLTLNYKNGKTEEYIAEYNDEYVLVFKTKDGKVLSDEADFKIDTEYGENNKRILEIGCYGLTLSFPIANEITVKSITFNPLKPVSIVASNGIESNRNTWLDRNGNVYYGTDYKYDYETDTVISEIFNVGDKLTVTFSNGKTVTYTYKAERFDECGYIFTGVDNSEFHVSNITSSQNEHPWVVGGNNYFNINFKNASTANIPVTITPAQGEHTHTWNSGVKQADGSILYTCTSCGATKTEKQMNFEDVTPDRYFYEPIKWAYDNDITVGTSPTRFSPDDACTRAQIVTFIWRAKGCPEPKTTKNPFTDVTPANYFYKAVLWAVENGITIGTSSTLFSPNAPCTRAQAVTFIWRAENEPSSTVKNPFTDVTADRYFYAPVLWALENGITIGTKPTLFSPDATCTRAQIVTFLYRDVVGNA